MGLYKTADGGLTWEAPVGGLPPATDAVLLAD